MLHTKPWLLTALVSLSGWSLQAATDTNKNTLIERKAFFGNPSKTLVTISPNGKWIAYSAPSEGVLNLWVAPFGKPEQAKVVTHDRKSGIRQYSWAANGEQLIYTQDKDGDENFGLFLVEVASAQVRTLSPAGKSLATILTISSKKKNEILMGLNDRDPSLHDVYRIDLKTGTKTLVMKNEGFESFVADESLNLRVAIKPHAGGGADYFRITAGKVEAKPLLVVPKDEAMTTGYRGIDSTGQTIYLSGHLGSDLLTLYALDIKSGKRTAVMASKKSDVGEVLFDPETLKPVAIEEEYLRSEWRAVDPSVAKDIDYLNTEIKGNWSVASTSDDNKIWVISVDPVTSPSAYFVYERSSAKKLTKLFTVRPELDGKPLVPMHPLEITARDGTVLTAYLTLPDTVDADHDGKPTSALPMVLYVHGGPWARDSYGYSPTHQWLANRGLAVLSVNYRGSGGFGKAFINKASHEFAGAMHNDLIDAVSWAVNQGIAQKDKVAIMGGSYGGYATLVGLTFTPDAFACGVDIVGPSNLVTLVQNFPPYWQPMMESSWYAYVGNPAREADKKEMLAKSPITKVDQIKKPLLIGQGSNDPRVTKSESDQIVAAMKAKSIPVTYALYPDEGHGFKRPENRISFYSLTEAFLGKCLGSAVQPIGNDLQGSSLQLPEGIEHIPGLKDTFKSAGK